MVALLQKQSITTFPVFDPRLILLDRGIDAKAEVIKRLTDNLEIEQRARCGAEVEAAIWQREAIFSTALGFAIALPTANRPPLPAAAYRLCVSLHRWRGMRRFPYR